MAAAFRRRLAALRQARAHLFVWSIALVVVATLFVKQADVAAHAASMARVAWLREIWYALGYHLGLLAFVQSPSVVHIPSGAGGRGSQPVTPAK